MLPDPRRKQAVVACELPPGVNAAVRVEGAVCDVAREGDAFTVAFEDAHYWSPDDPHTYRAALNLEHEGGDTESIEFPIALRQFTVAENRFRINQRPIPIRGAAIRAAEAADVDTIKAMAALGYNAVRLPVGELFTELLDFSDGAGVLVFATLPEAIDEESAAFINEHFNHPSLVAWHTRYRADTDGIAGLTQAVERQIASIREIDSTRLILCDVINAQGFPVLSVAANPNQTNTIPMQFARIAASPPMSAPTLQAARRFGAGDRVVTAEVVYPIATDRGEIQPDPIGEAIDDIVRALRMNERVAAYWIEGGHDPADAAPATLPGSVHQSVRPIAELSQRNLAPGHETNVRVIMANDTGMSGRAELSLQVVGPTGQVLWKKKRGHPIPKTGKEIWRGEVGASSKPGMHRFVVRVMENRRVLAQDDIPFHVLSELDPSKARVHIVGQLNAHPAALSGVVEESDAPVYVIPPLANSVWAYPAEMMCAILANVQDGAVAIVLSPPANWNELSACFDALPHIDIVVPGFASMPVAFHTGRHPILEGVRTADTMGSSYQNLRRNVLLAGASDEGISAATLGTFDASSATVEAISKDEMNDVIVRTFGEGKLIFANYDPLHSAGHDPAANNLIRNLVEYAERRAVPGHKPPPFQKAIDAWRKRTASLIRWRILAPLNAEAKMPTPPARAEDFDAHHAGAYGPAAWTDWWTENEEGCAIDIADCCPPGVIRAFGNSGLTAYAAHAFRSTTREPKTIQLESKASARLWVNGRLVGSTEESDGMLDITITTREGLNIIAVESEAGGVSWGFTFKMT